MKTELQKCLDGELFNTSDKEIQSFIHHSRKLTNSYNSTPSNNSEKRSEILNELFGQIGNNVLIASNVQIYTATHSTVVNERLVAKFRYRCRKRCNKIYSSKLFSSRKPMPSCTKK